ncbi:WecB/TagA/CpsF family glycosyltransferase [Rubellicoccus peritrichatus]|uniref:WecB/TagA/CpsF family glycosyltransferase n=1 Tax=Rubellicoccus peritrichatus TaxID=3080537 RepID=A0AAQ3QVG7_9BACT|nr:WecB/TagA/CpsF family glycosyltransferase [Puniceicoccus sp. CR14]WOO40802.1 WecB/TagA/CpsF family glycosyltransferase [Puniceicoccus sp. CR14]
MAEAISTPAKTITILGIPFFNGTIEAAITQTIEGGLLLAPSGPGLAETDWNHSYYKALLSADTVLIDSGLMALIWPLIGRQKLSRISGLRMLKALLANSTFRTSRKHFWVMPSEAENKLNREYLASIGMHLTSDQCYNAPYYSDNDDVTDKNLLSLIEAQKPRFVVINIAGGKQEILGAWLAQKLSYRPSIICTGAAIAFLTGEQAPIGDIDDRIYLGWLKRIIFEPKKYLGRYVKAFRLIPMLLRFREKSPTNNQPSTV